VATFASGDFVDFVEEDDAGVFDAIDGGAGDLFMSIKRCSSS